MNKGLGYLPYEKRMRMLNLKRRLTSLLSVHVDTLKRGCKEDRATLFPVVPNDNRGGYGHKLGKHEILSEHKKALFHWSRMPSEVVKSPPVEMFKT